MNDYQWVAGAMLQQELQELPMLRFGWYLGHYDDCYDAWQMCVSKIVQECGLEMENMYNLGEHAVVQRGYTQDGIACVLKSMFHQEGSYQIDDPDLIPVYWYEIHDNVIAYFSKHVMPYPEMRVECQAWGDEWNVYDRYTEFVQLQSRLEQRYPASWDLSKIANFKEYNGRLVLVDRPSLEISL